MDELKRMDGMEWMEKEDRCNEKRKEGRKEYSEHRGFVLGSTDTSDMLSGPWSSRVW